MEFLTELSAPFPYEINSMEVPRGQRQIHNDNTVEHYFQSHSPILVKITLA